MTTARSSPPASPHTGRTYYEALDGLRGLAVLFVILYHCFNYLPYFTFGWTGVDIFFVLSGFLITTTFLENRDGPRPIASFYLKRVLRIFPLYYLSLLLLLVILPGLIGASSLSTYPDGPYSSVGQQTGLWTFTGNWHYIFHAPHAPTGPSWLTHLWSLSLEEQYYLVWPWVLFLLKKSRSLLLFILALLCLLFVARFIAWQSTHRSFSLYYAFNFTRIEGLCVGSFLAVGSYYKLEGFRGKFLKAAVAVFAGCAALLLSKHFHWTSLPFFGFGGYLAISMAVALLILLFSRSKHSVLNLPLLVATGKISFGLYIIHWPLFVFLFPPLTAWLTPAGSRKPPLFADLGASAICILLSVVLAWISYHYYENYFLNLKKRLPFSLKRQYPG